MLPVTVHNILSVFILKVLLVRKNPETVEYLFGLGQLRHLGIPYNEIEHKYSQYLTNIPAKSPHYLGTTETRYFQRFFLSITDIFMTPTTGGTIYRRERNS